MTIATIFSGVIAAVMVALGVGQIGDFSKFKHASKMDASALQEEWFIYDSDSKDRSSIENPANYIPNPEGPQEQPDCSGLDLLCAVRAPSANNEPVLDETFVDEIMDILDDPEHQSNENIKLKPETGS